MWQLYMILFVNSGNASTGGPMIVDGFESESACIAHMKKIEESTPKERTVFGADRYVFHVKTCLKVDK